MRRRGDFTNGKFERRKSHVKPRVEFKIVCEGQITEKLYFDYIRKIYRANVLIIDKHGSPATITNIIIDEKRQDARAKRLDSWSGEVLYWAVFDKDDHPYVEDSLQRLRDNKIGVAFSNPCFELWLILHFQDHNRPDHRKEVQRLYEKLDDSYSRSQGKSADVGRLAERIADAEDRATILARRRTEENDPNGNPYTSVGDLTLAMRNSCM